MSVPLANDLVLLIISVLLLSFGLMDFKCGGVDLSMLCDKRSWSPGPAHEPSLRRDGFGRTNKPFNHRFCSWAQLRRSDKRPVLQQVCPKAAEQKRSCPTWPDFYLLI